jgi:hypothetical protein
MKVIIAGSRTITDQNIVDHAVFNSGLGISEVVCGGARGVDRLGEQWARGCTPVKIFLADWDTHGKAAGHIRNAEMAAYADALILVWDGESRGSADMLQKAKALGLLIHETVIPSFM